MPLPSFLVKHRKHVLLENESMIGDERVHPLTINRTTTKRHRVAIGTSKFLSRTKLKSGMLAKRIISAWNGRRQKKGKPVKVHLSSKLSSSSYPKLSIGKEEEKIVIPGKDRFESSTSVCSCSQNSTALNIINVVEPAIETMPNTEDHTRSEYGASEVESLGDCTGFNSDDMDDFNAKEYIAEPPIFFDDCETQTLEGAPATSRAVRIVVDGNTTNPSAAITDSNRGKVSAASQGSERASILSIGTKDKNKDSGHSRQCSPCNTFAGSDYFLCAFQGPQRAPITSNEVILSSTAWYHGMVEVVLGKQKMCSHCLEMVGEKEALVRVYPYADSELQKHFFHETCCEERRNLVIQKDHVLKEFEGFCALLRAHKKQRHMAKTFEVAMKGRDHTDGGYFELAGMKHFASKFSFIRLGRRK